MLGYSPESFVDYNASNLSGILGAGGDIAYLLMFVLIAALSMFFVQPHGRPPV